MSCREAEWPRGGRLRPPVTCHLQQIVSRGVLKVEGRNYGRGLNYRAVFSLFFFFFLLLLGRGLEEGEEGGG